MTRDHLIDLGAVLYGAAWQEPLGKALGIGRSELMRLLASSAPIPEDIANAVLALVETRLDELRSRTGPDGSNS